jgi:glucose-6-phosphate dehydrogenase assembly protein OpcA
VAQALTSFIVEHASGLHAVARRLDELHREAIRAVSADDDAPAVRLTVVNLVAVCTRVEDADLASQAVGVLSQTHPTRAIVVFADRNAPDSIEADISFQRGVRGGGDVTAEQVRLNVAGAAALHLDSVVVPLLAPDVPVYLWLVGAPPLQQAFGNDAVALAERILIDSAEYRDTKSVLSTIHAEVNRHEGIGLTDIAWSRSRVWRAALAQAFDGPDMRPFVHRITRAQVTSRGAQPSTQAWLFAGWLGDRLGWRTTGGPYVDVHTSVTAEVPDNELTSVLLTCVDRDLSATVRLDRRNDVLETTIDVDGRIEAKTSTPLRDPDIAHLVANLLEEGADDPMYCAALQKACILADETTAQ